MILFPPCHKKWDSHASAQLIRRDSVSRVEWWATWLKHQYSAACYAYVLISPLCLVCKTPSGVLVTFKPTRALGRLKVVVEGSTTSPNLEAFSSDSSVRWGSSSSCPDVKGMRTADPQLCLRDPLLCEHRSSQNRIAALLPTPIGSACHCYSANSKCFEGLWAMMIS